MTRSNAVTIAALRWGILLVFAVQLEVSAASGVSLIGQACTLGTECIDKGAAGTGGKCALNLCACATGFVPSTNNMKCLPYVNIGVSCVQNNQCPAYYDGSGTTLVAATNCTGTCTNSVCTCTPPAVASIDNTKCLSRINVNAPCVQDLDCPAYYNGAGTTVVTLAGTCTNSICACTPPAVAKTDSTQCLPSVVHIGESCVQDSQCPSKDATAGNPGMCTGNVCVCDTGFVKSDVDSTKCLPIIDGGWSSWVSSGDCSVTCGGGTQPISRQCNNPTPANGGADCSGLDTDTQTCNSDACPKTCSGANNSGVECCDCFCGSCHNGNVDCYNIGCCVSCCGC